MSTFVPCSVCGTLVEPPAECPKCKQPTNEASGMEPVDESPYLEPLEEDGTFRVADDPRVVMVPTNSVPVRDPAERKKARAAKKEAAAAAEAARAVPAPMRNVADVKAWALAHPLVAALAGMGALTFFLILIITFHPIMAGIFGGPGLGLALLGYFVPKSITWIWFKKESKKKKMTSLSDPDDGGNSMSDFMQADILAMSGGGIFAVLLIVARLGGMFSRVSKQTSNYNPPAGESMGSVLAVVFVGTGVPLLAIVCAYQYGPYRVAAWGYLILAGMLNLLTLSHLVGL